MDDNRLTIDAPVYLIGRMYSCWRCGAKMPVVAMLAPKVEGTAREICILSEITELPEAVLAYIQGRVPTSNLKFSKTIGQKYFASTCPQCGVLSGDFHFHSEPGAPFFPTDRREAASLYMTQLPVPGRIHARATGKVTVIKSLRHITSIITYNALKRRTGFPLVYSYRHFDVSGTFEGDKQ
jgi:hypothetical protein